MAKKKEGKKPKKVSEVEVLGFLGVGLDNDGHQRITNADHFLLVGGSEETHGKMQDTAIYFNEALDKRGKRLKDAIPEEIIDLMREAMDR